MDDITPRAGNNIPQNTKPPINPFVNSVMPPRGPKERSFFRKRVLLAIILFVLVVILCIVLIDVFSSVTQKHTVGSSHKVIHRSPAVSQTIQTATQTYTASSYGLTFSYPSNWTVFDNGNGPMTVTSPPMRLTAASGNKVTGQIIMTVQPQGQLPAGFKAGTDLAVLNSQIIKYTKPTPSQSAQTYISFVQYSSATIKGSLNGIYVTGNYGYQKDQAIPGSNIASINPLITITFIQCGNSSCSSNLNPLMIAASSWNNTAFQTPIVNIFESFVF